MRLLVCQLRTLFIRFAVLVFASVGAWGGAQAHPHIWIEAHGDVLFENGAIVGIRHHWTFDEYFSAWAVQGLDADGDGILTPEELQPLADENIVGLDEFSYYTFAGEDTAEDFGFQGASDPGMVFEDGRTTLTFTVLFDRPRQIRRAIDIEVGDPEYYIDFRFDGADAITLENAPDGCTVDVSEPQPLDLAIEERLFSLGPDVLELPEDLRDAVRDLANVVTITCPAQPASTALEAIEDVSANTVRRPPFAAPPAEPSIPMGQGGIMGWIGEQQRSFYQALTGALSALRDDWTAFWVLGGLSFLYGVFHAAGPGHGKIIISSYVLANERQLRRGTLLSFLAAMMQSVVAVAFVLVAAGALRLTSLAMSDAANWMAIGSYALIALLGAYLAARKILGFGHSHAHDHASHDHHHGHSHDHHHHDHAEHDHACGHHVVTPEQTGGDWRAQLGVIMAVGLRPCSGALVVLVFALTQGVLAAGIAATFMMGLGTAITVAALAALAVTFKGAALKLSGGGAVAGHVLWWLELAAALVVMAFGLVLLFASFG